MKAIIFVNKSKKYMKTPQIVLSKFGWYLDQASLGFGARMGRVIDLGQMLEIQPRVDLGGADIGVAEQLLHTAQVAAGLQHMAGKRVAQHVRVHRYAGVR